MLVLGFSSGSNGIADNQTNGCILFLDANTDERFYLNNFPVFPFLDMLQKLFSWESEQLKEKAVAKLNG